MKIIDRMIAAREKQARRYVVGSLLNLDDATLKAGGFDRASLKQEARGTYVDF